MEFRKLQHSHRMKTALIIGATGLTGSFLLDFLLADAHYSKVISLSRKALGKLHPKLHDIQGDLLQMNTLEDYFKDVTDVFVCTGTTTKKTPNKKKYRAIDVGIPVAAAQAAKKAGCHNFVVISAIGAHANSKIFYNALKGQMEAGVLEAQIGNTYFLRPSLIVGPRTETRLGEGLAKRFMLGFDFLIPKKHKAISAETIAKAMVVVALHGSEEQVIENDDIKEIAKKF